MLSEAVAEPDVLFETDTVEVDESDAPTLSEAVAEPNGLLETDAVDEDVSDALLQFASPVEVHSVTNPEEQVRQGEHAVMPTVAPKAPAPHAVHTAEELAATTLP